MKIRNGILTFAALAIPAFAADYTLDLKPDNTRITWTLADPLHTVHGTFTLKSGSIDFDPETSKASGQVVVDVTRSQHACERTAIGEISGGRVCPEKSGGIACRPGYVQAEGSRHIYDSRRRT